MMHTRNPRHSALLVALALEADVHVVFDPEPIGNHESRIPREFVREALEAASNPPPSRGPKSRRRFPVRT